MAVDFSHGCAHFTYSAFTRFREQVAACVGVALSTMEGHGGSGSWALVTDPIVPFLASRDVEISIAPVVAPAVADRLFEILTTSHPAPLGWGGSDWTGLDLVEGMREAALKGELFRSF